MKEKVGAKERGIICALLFVSLLLLNRTAFSEERENFKTKLSFKLTGGLGYMSLEEINRFLKTQSDLGRRAERFWPVEFSFLDEIENIHYGLNFEGELVMNISSNFAFCLSVEYIHARKESYSILRGEKWTGSATIREAYEPKVTIIPVKLGTYYRLSLFPRTALLFNIGGGYYFTKCYWYDYQHRESYDFLDASLETSWTEHTYEINGGNFGFHGGVGFEYSLGKNLSIVIEGQQRYVKIKELTGKDIMITSWGDKRKSYGTLWYHHYKSDDHYNTSLVLSDRKLEPLRPEDTVRKAAFDLSGFSLRVGIRIKLF